MTRKIYFLFLAILLVFSFHGIGIGNAPLYFNTPQLLSSVKASMNVVSVSSLPLKAHLEIKSAGNTVQEKDVDIQIVPKDSKRPNSSSLVKIAPVQLDGVTPGPYKFVLSLIHTQYDRKIASIETDITVNPGSNIDFSHSQWVYEDNDQDHYNDITEIMNGHYNVISNASGPPSFSWVNDPKEPLDSASKPDTAFLLKPSAISVMSPGLGGQVRVVGDPFSVQAGVNVIAELSAPNGSKKSKINSFSRLDGSFDLMLSNASVGDKVVVYVSSRNEAGSPSSLSLQGPSSKVEWTVKDLQGCQ